MSVRETIQEWAVAWYFQKAIAANRCPCSWPVKNRWLIRWCGRLADAHARQEFKRFGHWWMTTPMTTTTSSASNIVVTPTPPRKGHGA